MDIPILFMIIISIKYRNIFMKKIQIKSFNVMIFHSCAFKEEELMKKDKQI